MQRFAILLAAALLLASPSADAHDQYSRYQLSRARLAIAGEIELVRVEIELLEKRLEAYEPASRIVGGDAFLVSRQETQLRLLHSKWRMQMLQDHLRKLRRGWMR